MKLDHIALDQLKPSPLNVRAKGGKDVSDLIASIKSLGLLQPLMVRKNCEGFDIIAGERRFRALTKLAEDASAELVPCMILEDGEDAVAIEASLAENIARLPMDEIDQYKAFKALRGEGLSVDDIAAKFAVTERLVEQRLAIAAIITPILNAYRKDEIGPATLRTLTMATPKQQNAWWALFKSEEDHAPIGHALKSWLFGGAQIPVSNALFDVATFEGAVVSELFGTERYFADSDAFWNAQSAAIADKAQAYRDAGWMEVVILDQGDHFQPWNHVKTAKSKGGKAFIATTADGEVSFHEGWLHQKEIERRAKAAQGVEDDADNGTAKPERSELTKPMQNYLVLHRHAAVRTELLAHSGLALRMIAAHMIAGSSLWKVEAEPQRAANDAIASSLAASLAEKGFAAERAYIAKLLGMTGEEDDGDTTSIARQRNCYSGAGEVSSLLPTLLALDDGQILRILTFVMAETLDAEAGLVDLIGTHIGTDMKSWWEADQTFLDLMSDKTVLHAMLREVAGDITADAHKGSKSSTIKKIIFDCLKGEDRPKVEGWLPRYMTFPARSYGEAVQDPQLD